MWTQDMFGVEKPIIALLHLDALPGDPGYCGDMKQLQNTQGKTCWRCRTEALTESFLQTNSVCRTSR